MFEIFLISIGIIMGLVWNHYILKITPIRIEPQIIGVAVYGTVNAKASEDISSGDLVMFDSLGEVKKARRWDYE